MKLIDKFMTLIALISIFLVGLNIYHANKVDDVLWIITGITTIAWITLWLIQLKEIQIRDEVIERLNKELDGYDLRTN